MPASKPNWPASSTNSSRVKEMQTLRVEEISPRKETADQQPTF